MTLPVFLLEDRRTIHNLIYTVITTVKGSKEPLPWIKVNPLDLFIGLCADLFINGICGSVYELFYYSWLFVFFFVCLFFWLGTKLTFLQCTVGMTTIWTTNKHKTLRLGWIKLTREHAKHTRKRRILWSRKQKTARGLDISMACYPNSLLYF